MPAKQRLCRGLCWHERLAVLIRLGGDGSDAARGEAAANKERDHCDENDASEDAKRNGDPELGARQSSRRKGFQMSAQQP